MMKSNKISNKELFAIASLVGLFTFYVPFIIVGIPDIDRIVHGAPVTGIEYYFNNTLYDSLKCGNSGDTFNRAHSFYYINDPLYNQKLSTNIGSVSYDFLKYNSHAICECNGIVDTRTLHLSRIVRSYSISDPVDCEDRLKEMQSSRPELLIPIFLFGGGMGFLVIAPFVFLFMMIRDALGKRRSIKISEKLPKYEIEIC